MNCEWNCKFRRLFERMPYPGPKKKHHSILEHYRIESMYTWAIISCPWDQWSGLALVNALRQNLDTSSFKDKFKVVVVLILHTLQQHRLATHHMAHPQNCSCGHSFLKESLIALNLKFQVGTYTCSCSWWRSTKSPTKNVINRAWCQDANTWYGPSTSHYLIISFGTLWSW
jgi:hypothetical protein